MIVRAEDLASQLRGSGIESFEMSEFTGSTLRLLTVKHSNHASTNGVLQFLSALGQHIPDYVMPHLTIADVWHLAFKQWAATGLPMVLRAQCNHPVYCVQREGEVIYLNSALDVHESDILASVDPCGYQAAGALVPSDVTVVMLSQETWDKKPSTMQLPYAHKVIPSMDLDDRITWASMWFKDDIDGLSATEVKEGCAWINIAQHGLSNTHLVECPACSRVSHVTWQLNAETFL